MMLFIYNWYFFFKIKIRIKKKKISQNDLDTSKNDAMDRYDLFPTQLFNFNLCKPLIFITHIRFNVCLYIDIFMLAIYFGFGFFFKFTRFW